MPPRDTPKWLNKEESSKIEQWLDSGHIPGGKYGKYHCLAIAILYESGLRVTEVVGGERILYSGERVYHHGLLHEQANFQARKWTDVVRLKRRKDTRIDANLGPRTKRIYDEMYQDEEMRKSHIATARLTNNGMSPIFPKEFDRHRVYQFLGRLGKRMSIQRLTPHRLRHTAGRDIQDKTGDPSLVQAALGHAKMSTAMIYAEASSEKGLEALRNVRGE